MKGKKLELERLDELLNKLCSGSVRPTSYSFEHTDCIDEEDLEDYLDHCLHQKENERVELHLVKCESCFNRLMILRDLKIKEEIKVPERLINHARDLVVDSRPNCLELVLEFARNTINIIRYTGSLISPELSPAPIRGRGEKARDNPIEYVAVNKHFNDISVDVQIERINETSKLMVNCIDLKTEQPPKDIRLILSSLGRELSSVDESEGVFYIKPKKYIINILKCKKNIGEIFLDLRRSENN